MRIRLPKLSHLADAIFAGGFFVKMLLSPAFWLILGALISVFFMLIIKPILNHQYASSLVKNEGYSIQEAGWLTERYTSSVPWKWGVDDGSLRTVGSEMERSISCDSDWSVKSLLWMSYPRYNMLDHNKDLVDSGQDFYEKYKRTPTIDELFTEGQLASIALYKHQLIKKGLYPKDNLVKREDLHELSQKLTDDTHAQNTITGLLLIYETKQVSEKELLKDLQEYNNVIREARRGIWSCSE